VNRDSCQWRDWFWSGRSDVDLRHHVHTRYGATEPHNQWLGGGGLRQLVLKRTEANHSRHSNGEVKSAWCFAYAPPYFIERDSSEFCYCQSLTWSIRRNRFRIYIWKSQFYWTAYENYCYISGTKFVIKAEELACCEQFIMAYLRSLTAFILFYVSDQWNN
jgi:hypothetical protein